MVAIVADIIDVDFVKIYSQLAIVANEAIRTDLESYAFW